MDVLLQDLKYALRSLRRSPGYTAVVVAVMALGIGVNTMVFCMVYGVLYRPMPLPGSDRLAVLEHWDIKRDDDRGLSALNLRDFRAQMKTVEAVGGYWDHNAVVNIGNNEPERLFAATVSQGAFQALNVKPILGRLFTVEEEQIGKNWVPVLISHRIWKNRFSSSRDVLGKTIRLNGRTRTIVGVMPEKFTWPETQDFWIPFGFDPKDETRESFQLQGVARLKPGVTFAQADAEAKQITAAIVKQYPKEMEGLTSKVQPYKQRITNNIKPMMLLLQAAVAFVLLIACGNVANLMLARAAGRKREISMRMALGASRSRIMRQLLTESVLVSLAGAVLGVLLAHWGNRLWIAMVPLEMPFWLDFQIDTPVLLFTVGISVFAGLLFGFAPALHSGDSHLSEALREGSAQAGSSRGRNRLRSILVIGEIALSLVLLVGAGLMIRSFMKRYELQDHLKIDGVTTGAVLLPVATYPEPDQKTQFFSSVINEISALPGVEATSAAQCLPLGNNDWGRSVKVEGAKDVDRRNLPMVQYSICYPGFFKILGIPLKSGRDFQSTDLAKTQRVSIISESMAKKLWPGKDPIGRRFKFGNEDSDTIQFVTVIGVVGDVLQSVEDKDHRLEMAYVPHTQDPYQYLYFVVRSNVASGPLSAKIRGIIRSHNPDLALVDVRTFREHVTFSMWTHRLFTTLFGVFAILALIIAGVGIYGVMSYNVGQRTQEIGIRMALGAEPQQVVRMVTFQAARLTGLGIGIGLAVAFAVTRFMAAQLFEVSPTDPPTFTIVCVLLALSGIVAAGVPAMRAARVDPMVALRYE